MSCPRCSFPESNHDCCELCGLDDFAEFELNQHRSHQDPRFEITLTMPDTEEFQIVKKHLDHSFTYKITAEKIPQIFIFFDDTVTGRVYELLDSVRRLSGWKLLINGRHRPYSEELWLPVLQILTH